MEHDRFGNPMCGQSFMAGTVCSDRPGHAGGHSALCQECGGDWVNETCTCYSDYCDCCDRHIETPYEHTTKDEDPYTYAYCQQCYDWGCGDPAESCEVPKHYKEVVPIQEIPPSDNEVDEAVASITQAIRTLTTDPTLPAFSTPVPETDPSRKGPA